MKFRIPFVLTKDIEIAKRRSKYFIKYATSKKGALENHLKDSGENINQKQYLSICYRYFVINFFFFIILTTALLWFLGAKKFYVYGPGAGMLITIFIFFNQMNYPKMYSTNKARLIEKDLVSVLQDMLVQLNSGVPLFQILINISNSSYNEVSKEFKKITKEISAGIPQISAIEKHGKLSNSKYFKRVLWQISNGMRAGSDMTTVIREGIKNLGDEQAIQIQNYGGRLNPTIMFYMLIAVILPALAITFLIIIASILDAGESLIQLVFFLVMGFVVFMQIMFLGIIKSRRPSLL